MSRGQARDAGYNLGDPAADALPLSGVDSRQAAVLAAQMGGRLPTSAEWQWMAGRGVRRYPWGEQDPVAGLVNLRGLGPGRSTPVGSYPRGATPDGLLDVAGNVWEWTATRRPGGGAVVRGGSYNSLILYARCGFVNEVPAGLTSPGVGLRAVRTP